MKSFGNSKIRKEYTIQVTIRSSNPDIHLGFAFTGTANSHDTTNETLERSAVCLLLSENQSKNLKFGNDYFAYKVSISLAEYEEPTMMRATIRQ